MRIGMLGLGKLGLPVSVCLAEEFQVTGYDINPNLTTHRNYEHKEAGFDPYNRDNFQIYFDRVCNSQNRQKGLRFVQSLDEMVRYSDVIFVSVQTPHDPKYEGVNTLPNERVDFDYSYLIEASKSLAEKVHIDQTVSIISTVLPGTIRREILPILKGKCEVVYNPFFIAMGTVMKDFINPEFVLLGGSVKGISVMKELYKQYYAQEVPILEMSIESAELTKVAYNLNITTKICMANTLMEIAHKTPNCNVDEVTDALSKATKRILSPRYMRGGVGDGGSCHPRDNIAMSYLAQKLGVYDIFENLMLTREDQAMFLLEQLILHAKNLPLVLLGKSFKEETNITTGSCAMLCANFLKSMGKEFTHFDPYIDNTLKWVDLLSFNPPRAFLILTKHDCFREWNYPKGSVVIDPFRYIPQQNGVSIIPIGIGKKEL